MQHFRQYSRVTQSLKALILHGGMFTHAVKQLAQRGILDTYVNRRCTVFSPASILCRPENVISRRLQLKRFVFSSQLIAS